VLVVNTERLLEKARAAKRSSKYVVLGDVADLRDVVALANVGGGVIVTTTAPDVDAVRAELGFGDLELARIDRGHALLVGAAGEAPLTAGAEGAYFRHGARSVPATRDDLRRFMDRRVTAVKRKLLGDIKRVITAPEGSEVVAIERVEDDTGERVIRITTDEHAPLYRAVDFDVTHPYRQKELIAEVNSRLPEERAINAYEFQAVKRTNDIDPDFVHRPRFGTNQYSQAFVDWLVERIEGDPEFIPRARAEYQTLRVRASRSRG
jgi:hypothetical protein